MTDLITELAPEPQTVKLFNKWTYDDVEVKDVSLVEYLNIKQAVYLPHTAGRYQQKRFRKALVVY
jgi:small subunit ribosomal protein S5e